MQETEKQWSTNDAWLLINRIKKEKDADFSLVENGWNFYQHGKLIKTSNFDVNTPICWQVYYKFLQNL